MIALHLLRSVVWQQKTIIPPFALFYTFENNFDRILFIFSIDLNRMSCTEQLHTRPQSKQLLNFKPFFQNFTYFSHSRSALSF